MFSSPWNQRLNDKASGGVYPRRGKPGGSLL